MKKGRTAFTSRKVSFFSLFFHFFRSDHILSRSDDKLFISHKRLTFMIRYFGKMLTHFLKRNLNFVSNLLSFTKYNSTKHFSVTKKSKCENVGLLIFEMSKFKVENNSNHFGINFEAIFFKCKDIFFPFCFYDPSSCYYMI